MTRELRNSTRIETGLLDRGLAASSEAGDIYIRQGEAIADRVAAEGRGIESIGLARKNFQTAYGSGLRIGLILAAAGLASLLLLFGVSLVIDALRRPYPMQAYTVLLDQNAALLERVDRLGTLVTAPPAPAVAGGAGADPVAGPAGAGVATVAVPRDPASTKCPDQTSYVAPCLAVHVYADGRSYEGGWRNGLPDGEGRFTMTDGTTLDAVWKAGFPSNIKPAETGGRPLKTVTVFTTRANFDVANGITSVVAGHNFADGNSVEWTDAFCYASLRGEGALSPRIDLSAYEDAGSPVREFPYASEYSAVISRADYRRAQKACPYQRGGFN